MATKAKTVATKAPTGLAIKRNNETYTISWKIGDANYGVKHQLNYRLKVNNKWLPWKAIAIGLTTTAKSLTLKKADFYPNTSKQLQTLEVRIRGQRSKAGNTTYTVSGWATKAYNLWAPSAPTITANPDDTLNRCVFTWNYADNATSQRAFTNVEYQTMLVDDIAVDDVSKLKWVSTAKGWQTGSVAVSGNYSRTITENTEDIAVGSHTRVFRVRARGAYGTSGWRSAKRVYAAPNQAVIKEEPQTNVLDDGSTQVYVPWEVSSNNANPTSSMVIEYAIGTPRANMQPPLEPSWTEVGEAVLKGASNAISYVVTQPLDDDQCIWTRVNTLHLNQTTEGVATLARVGNLAMPTITTVSTNENTHKATVTAVNHSDVPDSYLVVLMRRESMPESDTVIGILPHGTTSATFDCPVWAEGEAIAFGVYAVVGTATQLVGKDGTNTYSIDAKMRSADTAWKGGEVPKAPENVAVYATTTAGTVRVRWSWSWSGADSAVISWADHADAWESTDEPEDYTVSNLNASEWNIAGLETGKKWYIRVRLAMTKEDGVTYSPWSAMQTVDLSSAPTIPTLVLSDGVIPVGGVITAYWSYATTDGTNQAYAQICECTVTASGVVYGDTITEVETAQHVEIDTASVGWSAGETHYLAVRVVSGSGKVSDGWSAPVPIMIAEPLEAEITSTSLVTKEIATNPQTYTGNPVTFEREALAPYVDSLTVELDPTQDLHGYDHPWVGGAGKNLCPITLTSGTEFDGVVLTVGSDGSVTLNGTATANRDLNIFPTGTALPLAVGTYTLSGCPSDGSATTYRLRARIKKADGSNKAFLSDTGRGDTVTLEEGEYFDRAYIETKSGYTYNNLTFYPMIEKSSTKTAYEPYENICPISGRTQVETHRTGKNLLDNTLCTPRTSGGVTRIINSDGTITLNGTSTSVSMWWRATDNMNVKFKAGTYTVSLVCDVPSTILRLLFRNAGEKIGTFTLTEDDTLINVRFTNSIGTTFNNTVVYPQIELGSTATAYEPYQGDTYPTDLGRTVYGGTLDVVSGMLTVDRAMVDLGTLTWTYATVATSNYFRSTALSGAKSAAGGQTSAICSDFETYVGAQAGFVSADSVVWVAPTNVSTNPYACIKDSRYTDATAFKTAMDGVQLVYELATPQTYQLTPTEVETLVGSNCVWSDLDTDLTIKTYDEKRTATVLDKLPMTVKVVGAGAGGTTMLAIERAAEYHMDRPDESVFNGYDGETVFIRTQTGEDTITIEQDDLSGYLDDGAQYRIVATVRDGLGQASTVTEDFEVDWAHQAVLPTATIVIEDNVAKITPIKPSGYIDGDVVDVYRLSADKPELVLQGCEFGVTYVDPYPAIGEYGGYRVVYRTKDGDYITASNQPAWVDYGEEEDVALDLDYALINFDGNELAVRYNMGLSNSWEKDFKQTRYLGGSIQGDWNKGVLRSGSIDAVTVAEDDTEALRLIRRLADYTGICHIRTPEGSSFACDIQVSDSLSYESAGKLNSFNLNINKVDPEGYDGITLAEWEDENGLE